MPLFDASGQFPDTSIKLCTRAGNPIDNTQTWQHSKFEWNQLGEDLKRFKNATPLGDPSEACPVYNCHGLTFGSRRTQVGNAVLPILADDGFEILKSEKDVRTGDVVIYSDRRGEVVHSGFIVFSKEIEIVFGTTTVIPMVWSKWGKAQEFLHAIEDCPFIGEEGTQITYYRLRKWKPPATTSQSPAA